MKSYSIASLALVLLFAFSALAHGDNTTYVSTYLNRTVRTRTQWGAQPGKTDMTPDAWKRCFAIHHSAGPAISSDDTLRGIQNYHMNTRRWSDIGYHFLVGPDGRVFQGRELAFQGAHVADHNKGTIGMNFLGCYDTVACNGRDAPKVAMVTEAMISAMGKLVGVLSLRYNITLDPSTVKGHREFSGTSTACPGDLIMARMPGIREIAQDARRKAEDAVRRGKLHDEL